MTATPRETDPATFGQFHDLHGEFLPERTVLSTVGAPVHTAPGGVVSPPMQGGGVDGGSAAQDKEVGNLVAGVLNALGNGAGGGTAQPMAQ